MKILHGKIKKDMQEVPKKLCEYKGAEISEERAYRDKHFGAGGYCVDTSGRNEGQIRRYIKDREKKDKSEK